MSVVAATLYRHGEVADSINIEEPIARSDDSSEFVWIGLLDPTPAELRELQRQYDLHPLAVQEARSPDQLPRVEIYGDQILVIVRTARLDDDEIAYGDTAILVGRQHIITIRHGSARSHSSLREQLEAAPSLLKRGVVYVLHAILGFLADGYTPLVEAIEDEVLAMEQRTIDGVLGRAEITRIFTLRRELMRFKRVLDPLGEAIGKLTQLDVPFIDPDARPYFALVQDRLRRVEAKVDGLCDTMTSVFELSNLLEQQRTGEITRQLAAWAAILAVPTAIAGIYGMNFEYMPELKTHYGYFAILGIIATLCGFLFFRFKKTGWL